MLCAADGPDEVDFLGGDAALGSAGEEVADGEHVMCYASAGGEKNGCAVGCGVGGVTSVGSLYEAGSDEGAVGRDDGFVVEFAGHAFAGSDDEGDGGKLVVGFRGEEVGELFFKAGRAHALFVAVGLLEGFGFWVVWGCDG